MVAARRQECWGGSNAEWVVVQTQEERKGGAARDKASVRSNPVGSSLQSAEVAGKGWAAQGRNYHAQRKKGVEVAKENPSAVSLEDASCV